MWFLFLACTPDPPTQVLLTDPAHRDGQFWIDAYEYPNVPGEPPLVGTTLEQAQDACAAQGKQLCTAAEWRRACSGPTGDNRFGYGPTFDAKRCPGAQDLGGGHTSMGDAAVVQAAGERAGCVTPEGVYDLIGNAEEWVLDDWQGRDSSLEGGAAYTFRDYADCTGRYSRQPDFRTPVGQVFSAGFRCCQSETPPDADAVARDARDQLAQSGSSAEYDPTPEDPLGPATWIDRYEYPNRPGERPRTVVTWDQAAAACDDAGKRLCTTWEWETACAGPRGERWPFGDTWVVGACPVSLSGPAESGAYPGCVSASGTRDLVGGAWEWTADAVDAPGLSKEGDTLRELRGGSWLTEAAIKGVCRPWDGYPVAPQSGAYPDLGFRCCRGETLAPSVSEPVERACPEHMVPNGDGCIDAYELPGIPGEAPMVHVTLTEARAMCTVVGKHLCTEAEWTAACEGPDHRRWPYGNTFDLDACYQSISSGVEQTETAQPGGAFPACVTPEGAYDMSGNVWEWVDRGDAGVLRGGAWSLSAGLNQCRAIAEPTDGDYTSPRVGARCCASSDQVTALLGG